MSVVSGRAKSLGSVVALILVATIGSLPSVVGAPASAATDGTATAVDTSFGGGLVKTNLSPLDDEVLALAVQPDGATVVVGSTNHDPFGGSDKGEVLVARYTATGRLDTAFGSGGKVVVEAPGTVDKAFAVTVQPDGKIVVGAQVASKPAIIRLTPDGQLDPEFQGGIVTIAEAGSSAKAVAVRPDGGIAFAGDGIVLGRLNADGSRDGGYGANGVVTMAPDVMTATTAFVLPPDGRLLIGGYSSTPVFWGSPTADAVVARYLPSGQLDATFGNGGVVTTTLDTPQVDRGAQIASLAVQPDGKIVAAGLAYIYGSPASPPSPDQPPAPTPGIVHRSLNGVALFRYLPNGRLDTTFAGTGHVITRVPGQSGPGSHQKDHETYADAGGTASAVLVDSSGGILVGGSSRQPFFEPTLLRYTPSGLLDTSFGRTGELELDMGGPIAQINAMALTPDGRVVVGGTARTGIWFEPGNYGDLLVGRVIPGSKAGTVWTWGWNALGQLGDGTTVDRSTPARVPGLTGVVSVSASPYHTLALRGDGTVWAWGYNAYGQLGDGTTVDRRTPVQVPGLSGVVAISAGGLHSLALLGDGTVRAWGFNVFGQLGDGTTTTRLRPVAVKRLAGVTQISAGIFHNLAVREDGSGWAWGYNGLGQLGDRTNVDRHVPVPLPPNDYNIAYFGVSAGWLHSTSMDEQGFSRGWGWNGLGQVAGSQGGADIIWAPLNLSRNFVLSAGGYHTLMVWPEGPVVSRGWNGAGQLGVGPGGPVIGLGRVSGLDTVSSVSAGGVHSLATSLDRQVWAWGWNYFGQLGVGTTATATAPIRVGLSNVVLVAAGGYHSAAIRA